MPAGHEKLLTPMKRLPAPLPTLIARPVSRSRTLAGPVPPTGTVRATGRLTALSGAKSTAPFAARKTADQAIATVQGRCNIVHWGISLCPLADTLRPWHQRPGIGNAARSCMALPEGPHGPLFKRSVDGAALAPTRIGACLRLSVSGLGRRQVQGLVARMGSTAGALTW
jgi:hypothetical protein